MVKVSVESESRESEREREREREESMCGAVVSDADQVIARSQQVAAGWRPVRQVSPRPPRASGSSSLTVNMTIMTVMVKWSDGVWWDPDGK